MHIVIVDDSRSVHAYVVDLLSGTQTTFDHYYNGQEAADALGARRGRVPDVILLDWEMPVLNGIDALPSLRASLPSTPIIMTTSKNVLSDIVQALEKGASDYMMKPFTKDILIGKIEQLINAKVA